MDRFIDLVNSNTIYIILSLIILPILKNIFSINYREIDEVLGDNSILFRKKFYDFIISTFFSLLMGVVFLSIIAMPLRWEMKVISGMYIALAVIISGPNNTYLFAYNTIRKIYNKCKPDKTNSVIKLLHALMFIFILSITILVVISLYALAVIFIIMMLFFIPPVDLIQTVENLIYSSIILILLLIALNKKNQPTFFVSKVDSKFDIEKVILLYSSSNSKVYIEKTNMKFEYVYRYYIEYLNDSIKCYTVCESQVVRFIHAWWCIKFTLVDFFSNSFRTKKQSQISKSEKLDQYKKYVQEYSNSILIPIYLMKELINK